VRGVRVWKSTNSSKVGNSRKLLELNQGADALTQLEVDSIFRHFDSQGKGYITKEEFIRAFEMPVSLDTSIKVYESNSSNFRGLNLAVDN